MTMSLHSGLAASNGIKSTQLAMQGFTADPNIFDGPNNITQVMNGQCSNEHIQEHLSSWGQPFMISDPGCTFKLYPCGRPPLFAIDCVIALQEQHHFSIDDIQDIECEVSYMYPRTLIHSNPINGLQGKTSLEYCIAAAIVDARPKLESFTDQAIQRENIQKIMRCIRVIVPPHLSEQIESVRKAPFEQPVTLHVTTRNGKRLSHTVHHHKGSPENPASHADLLNKFKDAVAPWLEVHQSNEVMNLFNSTQTPVRSLMQALQIR
jgi:2-methylcitrate dehydratase PrpD